MLRIHFTAEDLTKITVAQGVDPLWELVSSLHLLQEKGDTIVFGEWRRRTLAARPAGLDLLTELAPPCGYTPDFLTPGRGPRHVAELVDEVLSTPRRQRWQDLGELAAQRRVTPWLRALAADGVPPLRALGTALTSYYEVGLAPYRGQMAEQARVDRERRGRLLLTGGVDKLLSSLHPRTIWKRPTLQILDYVDRDLYLRGRGLVLIPSLFCRSRPWTLKNPDLPPVLVYPVSPRPGWLARAGPDRLAVHALLGGTRAAAMEACVTSCTTTELARRICVSTSAASRQAAVLRRAGLINTRRRGGSVIHEISDLGIALLNGRVPS